MYQIVQIDSFLAARDTETECYYEIACPFTNGRKKDNALSLVCTHHPTLFFKAIPLHDTLGA
jgi:hypothetical protein